MDGIYGQGHERDVPINTRGLHVVPQHCKWPGYTDSVQRNAISVHKRYCQALHTAQVHFTQLKLQQPRTAFNIHPSSDLSIIYDRGTKRGVSRSQTLEFSKVRRRILDAQHSDHIWTIIEVLHVCVERFPFYQTDTLRFRAVGSCIIREDIDVVESKLWCNEKLLFVKNIA